MALWASAKEAQGLDKMKKTTTTATTAKTATVKKNGGTFIKPAFFHVATVEFRDSFIDNGTFTVKDMIEVERQIQNICKGLESSKTATMSRAFPMLATRTDKGTKQLRESDARKFVACYNLAHGTRYEFVITKGETVAPCYIYRFADDSARKELKAVESHATSETVESYAKTVVKHCKDRNLDLSALIELLNASK